MKYRFATIGMLMVFAAMVLLLPHSNYVSAQGTPLDHLNKIQKRLVSGFASYELSANNATNSVGAARNLKPIRKNPPVANSYNPGNDGCNQNLGNNVKVNETCLNLSDPDLQGRGQAQNETSIAADPNHPNHLIAGYNDYRRGDGTCGASFSLDNGQTWQDATMPNGFTRGGPFGAAREYWQASGDPAVAWDSKGNAYYQCMMFLRGQPTSPNPDQSSAVYVFRSTQNNGASYNFPGRPVVEYNDVAGTGCCLEDKPYMAVDNHVGSPFQDRIYVTWTEFLGDGTAYIWEAYSSDYGEHFSNRVLVSGNNTSLCTNTFGIATPHGNCNENQFSDPFVGPDGALYVAFANYNNSTATTPPGRAPTTGIENYNQILLAKSTDGGQTFSLPIKVSNYYDLPDCATYQGGQDAGRACVPEKGSSMNSVFRATNYPSGDVNPKNPKQVVVTFGSYINMHSNESNGCVPEGFSVFGLNLYDGVKTPGACNNDILISVSNDAGATFTGTTTDPRQLTSVTQEKAQATTDQWFQWTAFNQKGQLATSYYDRQYGNDETTGSNDVSISASPNVTSFGSKRVTSASMPSPTQFPDAQGNSLFFGDYSGLVAVRDAHPFWSDTRNQDLFLCPGTGAPGTPPAVCTLTEPNGLVANDQDVFTTAIGLPGSSGD